jgi:hypothetical protein
MGEGVENLRFSRGKLLKKQNVYPLWQMYNYALKLGLPLYSKLRLKFSKNSKIQNNHIFDAKFKLKPKRLKLFLLNFFLNETSFF